MTGPVASTVRCAPAQVASGDHGTEQERTVVCRPCAVSVSRTLETVAAALRVTAARSAVPSLTRLTVLRRRAPGQHAADVERHRAEPLRAR